MTLVEARLAEHAMFQLAARPKTITPLTLFSRYEPGMQYGSHVDDALMNGVRTDVSFTLFLSDPELWRRRTGHRDEQRRGRREAPRRFVVAYPSTSLHRVAPVMRGARLAAVGWVRSFVRDAAHRELLFDLDTARQALFVREGKTAEPTCSPCANLLRMWAED